jgi:hypothetical protein
LAAIEVPTALPAPGLLSTTTDLRQCSVSDDAPDDIAAAAGRERHDHAHGLVRIAARPGFCSETSRRQRQHEGTRDDRAANGSTHSISPWFLRAAAREVDREE